MLTLTTICRPTPTVTGALNLFKCSTTRWSFQFFDASGVLPLDLTNAQVVFHLVKSGATTDFLTLTSTATPLGSKTTITNALTGTAEVLLTDEESCATTFLKGDYLWWIEIKYPLTGESFRKSAGTLTVKYPFVS